MSNQVEKCPTGIAGFDEISYGGLPLGRPTLVAGHAGSGKTLFALQFVLNGTERFGEPGVFVTFEESAGELAANVASLGHDVARYVASDRLRVVNIVLEPHTQVEAGQFDLEGLFLRLGAAVGAVGARRVAIDAVENLFSAFSDQHVLRGEFRRLMGWLKDRGVTALVTTERGQTTLTRNGIEEYIADCVIALDNRVEDQLATRRLRIVKYRGSAHHGDECPFVVDRSGFAVMPITSAGLAYTSSREKVSSGITGLDEMLSGGYYRGSSVLVSGTSGAGKTSIAAHFVDAGCRRGERALFVALEESPDQIERNMASIGIDLDPWRRAGLLQFHAARPTSNGLERHLVNLVGIVEEFRPAIVAIDPITAYRAAARDDWVKQMLVRAVDLFKGRGVTSLFTALSFGGDAPESTAVAISSLVDAWLLLRNLESYGERTRALYVCKARGMAHSNQVREFLLGDRGVELVDVAIDTDGQVITGSARQLLQSRHDQRARAREADEARRRKALDAKRRLLEARIAALRAELDEEIHALEAELTGEGVRIEAVELATAELVRRRQQMGGDGE